MAKKTKKSETIIDAEVQEIVPKARKRCPNTKNVEKITEEVEAELNEDNNLSVTPSKITVKKGKKAKISMVGKSNVGNLGMVYRSSNKKVASVSSTGVVTGKKAGKAVITVEFNGKKVKVPVVVTK